jgi:hypothetical protein
MFARKRFIFFTALNFKVVTVCYVQSYDLILRTLPALFLLFKNLVNSKENWNLTSAYNHS